MNFPQKRKHTGTERALAQGQKEKKEEEEKEEGGKGIKSLVLYGLF